MIAAEDQRFFSHPGYDLAELMPRRSKPTRRPAQVERGGSTLTQQLAKLLVTGGERTADRKLRELLYAVEMEQTLGKARILQLYLDNAPWGSNLCGAEAAARRYFKRSARNLEPAQAVWLAAMLHNPSVAVEKWQRDGTDRRGARQGGRRRRARHHASPSAMRCSRTSLTARFAPP